MEFEPIIGLEVHVQLNTKSKIFCACSTRFGNEPNTNVCPVCLGLPGVLPVLNREVLHKTVLAGLALGCEISSYSKFDRKQYFYPDLPKNYQISQYDAPLCKKGSVEIRTSSMRKKISITRIHMEEDAGKLIHEQTPGRQQSLVDFNRTGVPLVEIVSEPEISSPEEAVSYLTLIKSRLRYADVSDCNMEEGSLRCDANISMRPKGQKELGIKVEVKNMNSFKAVEKALKYEIKRQTGALEKNERIVQETRLWDSEKEITVSMRSKEEAHDYRYFPEPDLVPVMLDRKVIEEASKTLPELPDKKAERYVKEYGLPETTAEVLTQEQAIAGFFEACLQCHENSRSLANWIMSELLQYLNRKGLSLKDLKNLKPGNFARLVQMVDSGAVTGKVAKEIVIEVMEKDADPAGLIEQRGLSQVSDEPAIEKVVDEVLQENPDAVKKFKSGKEGITGFLVGQVMKKTLGKANPQIVNRLLEKKLK